MRKDAQRVGVYGRSGSGKSYHVKRSLLAGRGRVVVFDPMDEYAAERFRRADTLAAVLAELRRGWGTGFRIAYVPPAGREPEYLHRLSVLLAQAQAPYLAGRDGRKLTLVVEELNLSFPVGGLPRELSGFGELCSRGRHYGIELVGVSQRVAEVGTRFRGNTDRAYIFGQADHTSRRTILQMIGPGWGDRLASLGLGEHLVFEGGAVREGGGKSLRKVG
jgi:hypothetical protein